MLDMNCTSLSKSTYRSIDKRQKGRNVFPRTVYMSALHYSECSPVAAAAVASDVMLFTPTSHPS